MNRYHKFLMFVLVSFFALSCDNFIGDGINENPDKPLEVPIGAQMPNIEINLADFYGGAFPRFNSMLVQQVEGVNRQWTSFNQYTGLTPNRFDAAWQNIYENILNEIKLARISANAEGLNHYLGVLDVIEAFTLMTATDVWDNMPYENALNGLEAVNPTYNTQDEIYKFIHQKLDEAIPLLAGPSGPVIPGGDDVFYGGDVGAWTKAAHAIKARALMKADDYAGAAAQAAMSFGSAADNLAFQYPDASHAGQWYRFDRDRTGDIEFHPNMRALMNGLNDTMRLKQIDQIFDTDHTYLVADFNQELITYREMQFIMAEADVRAGGTQAGHDAYLEGIRASFERLGLWSEDDSAIYDDYVAQPEVDPGVGNLTLEMVMIQKYIAMFLQPENYCDWRRTNIPELTPVSGSAIPVRWHYSSDEYLFNSNSPAETDVNIFTDNVGWDK